MEDSLKHKSHHRPKRRPDKLAVRGSERGSNVEKSASGRPSRCRAPPAAQSPDGQSTSADHSSPGVEVQNCSQFIEHEPIVIWDSPQASPTSANDQNSRIIDLITPPQEKRLSKKKPVAVSKPARKLPEAVSPSFLTKLMDLSEQYKDSEDPVPEERQQEEKVSHDTYIVPDGHLIGNPSLENFQKRNSDSSSSPVIDNFDMLLDDDDDDIIIKFSQQIEETINEAKCDNFGLLNVSVPPHSVTRKSKLIQARETNTSTRHATKTAKDTCGRNNNVAVEHSPQRKVTVSLTPGRAKFYKNSVFIGYGSRKSPRTKKNIMESVNSASHQDVCDDSFENALQTFVDDDCSFSEVSVDKDCDRTTGPCDKRSEKRRSMGGSKEQTPNTKLKTHQCGERNLSNSCCIPPKQLKPAKGEQTNTKSKTGNPKKRTSDASVIHLTENGEECFETVALDDDMVNETDLVNVLEIVESQTVPSSPPLRCTPEEIQRKRIEAKQKLAKKKLSASNRTCVQGVVKPKR